MQSEFTSREGLYDYLDSYAQERRAQIDKHDLSQDKGLIKSYIVETSHHEDQLDIPMALKRTDFQVDQVGKDQLFTLSRRQQQLGFIEPLGTRHLAIHSTMQNAKQIDDNIHRLTRRTPDLDSLWLAGIAFQRILTDIVKELSPLRNTVVKFEFSPDFSRLQTPRVDDSIDELNTVTTIVRDDIDIDEDMDIDSHSASVRERVSSLALTLKQYQAINPAWRSIRGLRIPGSGHGGYDLYSWGKLTHRTSNFREGHSWLRELDRIYERATQAIEEAIWLDVDTTRLSDGMHSVTLNGAPVVCRFEKPLSDDVFRNFITSTFDRGEGLFRLWGRPIFLGDHKVHIYGLDLHLWQQLYMELTPSYFTFILPKGTCGNTVHRLVTNIQRSIDPGVTVSVGAQDYDQIIIDAILGRGEVNG